MDFMSMSETSHGYDSIAVVIDQLSKMGHFIPTRKDIDAKQFAQRSWTKLFDYTDYHAKLSVIGTFVLLQHFGKKFSRN